jgi:hypothetical protein
MTGDPYLSVTDDQAGEHAWMLTSERAAAVEGWAIFDSDGSISGPWQVQRDDEREAFASDDEVWPLVVGGALCGRGHHVAALGFVRWANSLEWARMLVSAFTGLGYDTDGQAYDHAVSVVLNANRCGPIYNEDAE